jgi:hypothetical protein
MTILFATHNKGKIKRYRELFRDIQNLNLMTLEEMGISFKADEPYHTPEENAIHKARTYGKLSNMPTIAIDEAVETNFLPDHEQPGVFVRRFRKGKELSDTEVLEAWKEIFTIYPASDHLFTWDFRIAYFNPQNDNLRTSKVTQLNSVAKEFSKVIDPGYPMSSFLIPEGFDRPHSELSPEECLWTDTRTLRPFITFMEGITNEQNSFTVRSGVS